MKKKWGLLTICLMMSAVLLAACGQKQGSENAGASSNTSASNTSTPASESPSTEPSTSKTLVVGLSADYPPYEFHMKSADGQDQIVGFDVDIANEIAKDMNAKLELKDMQFSSLLNELASGRVDLVLSALSPTKERAEQVDLSKVYYKAQQAVVVPAGDKDKYATMDSLKGKSIGVQTGSIQEEIAKGIQGAKLTSLAKTSDVIMQLKSGRIDAAIIEGPVAESYVKNVPGLAITDAKPVTQDDGYVIGVKKGNTEVLNEVNATLDRLASSNMVDQFVQHANELADQQAK